MRHSESELQRTCVAWFRLQFPHYARLLFAVPNGGKRNRTEAAIMHAEGITAGVSDLILLVPRAPCHGLCIEMKFGKNTQTPLQRSWQSEVEAQGYRYVVCTSVEEFISQVGSYLGLDAKKFQ